MRNWIITIICAILAFIPEYIAIGLYILIAPVGFWQVITTLGLFLWFGLVISLIYKFIMVGVWATVL